MRRFWIGLCAVGLFALCAAGTVWGIRFLMHGRASRRFLAAGPAKLVRERTAAQAVGILLDAGQLQQPLPPVSQNAAPLYVKLTKLLHDRPICLPKYAEGMDAFHSYTPAQIAAVRKILSARPDVMTLVHQAAARPQCVFVRDWNKGLDLQFPESLPIREAARLLKTESYLLARDGHYPQAVANQALGFRAAEHAASDHVLIAYLVGNASESITLSGMQSILALAGPNPAVDAEVKKAVTGLRPRLFLREALRDEPAAMAPVFTQLHAGQGQGAAWLISAMKGLTDGGKMPVGRSRNAPVSAAEQKVVSDAIDSQQASYLADTRHLITAMDGPEANRRSAIEAVMNPSAEDVRVGIRALSFMLMPDALKLDEDEKRIHAREAVTLAAADVLAERAASGAYPDRLPPGFTDPFSGQPLQYRREGAGGFVVYSVGPTGRFDGGKPGQKMPGAESLFRYPAVP